MRCRRAAAGAALRRKRDEIEFERASAGRIDPIVHANCAHHAIRQAAQAAHRGERDAATGNAAAPRVVEQPRERRPDDFERDGRFQPAALHPVEQLADRDLHRAEVLGPFRTLGNEACERAIERIAPARRVFTAQPLAPQLSQLLDKAPERSERLRPLPFRVPGADAAVDVRIRFADRVPEVKALQAIVERVICSRRQLEILPFRGLEPPADAGFLDPRADRIERFGVQREAPATGACISRSNTALAGCRPIVSAIRNQRAIPDPALGLAGDE